MRFEKSEKEVKGLVLGPQGRSMGWHAVVGDSEQHGVFNQLVSELQMLRESVG